MIPKTAKATLGRGLLDAFRAAGAVEVAPDILLGADTLLDLYGEDIRARAYVTTDPVRGEVVLRPDFTVPVVQMHMAGGADPARYCYLGEVFRKQDQGDTRPDKPRDNEYFQAGFELFSREPGADAELFVLFHRVLQPFGLNPVMGDMRLLLDAVQGLPVSDARRAALAHHVWRPGRFQRLLDRFSEPATPRLFGPPESPWSGLRGRDEMAARIARMQADAEEPPLPTEWRDRLTALFGVAGPLPAALATLQQMAADIPSIEDAVSALAARLDAVADAGVDPEGVRFDASHGRHTMEYYDGMTFSFYAPGRDDWPAVASGGRYDALTAMLGQGRAIPAVGGIIRPGLLAEMV